MKILDSGLFYLAIGEGPAVDVSDFVSEDYMLVLFGNFSSAAVGVHASDPDGALWAQLKTENGASGIFSASGGYPFRAAAPKLKVVCSGFGTPVVFYWLYH